MDNLNLSNVRVRIAPSPTGFVHMGTLRTILYNYLFAKHYKGQFIIRIEDTDQTRLVPGAVEDLLRVMRWAGFENDEGPCLTKDGKIKERGEFGPYAQSQRLDIYKKHAQILLEKNKAYHCFCSKERLENLRNEQIKNKQAPKYDNFCRNLSPDEVKSMINGGATHVVRFKMPENKTVLFSDLIRGEISVNSKDLDDFVLLKADGYPTYNFANVIDDHLMKISQIMRGEEFISSTPKYALLYEAYNWQPPQFAHLPQLLSKQRKKLSKRDGDTNVQEFIDKGYLKDAIINFIALLGWNSGTEQEIYTLEELVKQFSLDGVHKSGAIFDIDKLDWINGAYIRKMSVDEFYNECAKFLFAANLITKEKEKILINATNEKVKPAYVKNILALEQSRIKKLSDISAAVEYFFKKDLEYDAAKLVWKKSDKEKTLANLSRLAKLLKKTLIADFTKERLEKSINGFIAANNIGAGDLLWPMRFALSGKEQSPGPFEIAAALGKSKTLERINEAITKLI
ncbi:MAG: glutamate--tRNA ligase [Parcubacteria group bacterium]